MRTDGPPLGILPLGTANNIAAALSLSGSLDALISSWEAGNLRPFYRFGVEGPWGRFVPRKGSGSDQQKRTVLLNSLDSLATVIIHSGALLNPFISSNTASGGLSRWISSTASSRSVSKTEVFVSSLESAKATTGVSTYRAV
jgi:Diacylglycerol kinase catalytic domain